jgi:RNA polymerase sigma factor (sigma-70 family)
MGVELELTQDKINLIERIVKNDRKFAGNEDLYEDFFNETCKRSLTIISSVDSDNALEAYLRKIATTSIINVLKDSGRLRRTGGGYVPTKEVVTNAFTEPELVYESPAAPVMPITPITPITPVTPAAPVRAKVSYKEIHVKETPEDFIIKKEILERVNAAVRITNENYPDKSYLALFNMRYGKSMTQREMADALGISQSEVSKRLMKLMDNVKKAFN